MDLRGLCFPIIVCRGESVETNEDPTAIWDGDSRETSSRCTLSAGNGLLSQREMPNSPGMIKSP